MSPMPAQTISRSLKVAETMAGGSLGGEQKSPPNKPLKLPSAGFSCAGDPSRGAVQDHDLTARARALAQRPAGHDHAQR